MGSVEIGAQFQQGQVDKEGDTLWGERRHWSEKYASPDCHNIYILCLLHITLLDRPLKSMV